MNKQFQYILAGSLAALFCATGGALFLAWQSLEESRALEQRNQELQASLEVSRIRVENFCEYPQEALCRVDERTGTVAGAMYHGIPGSPEVEMPTVMPAGIAADAFMDTPKKAQPEAEAMEERGNDDPSKALRTVQKVAEVQKKVAAEIAPAVIAEAETSELAPVRQEEPKKPVAVPEEREKPEPAKMPATHAGSASTAKEEDTKEEMKPETVKAVSTASSAPSESSVSAAPSADDSVMPYRHEVSGKLALPPAPEERPEAPTASAPDSVQEPKKENTGSATKTVLKAAPAKKSSDAVRSKTVSEKNAVPAADIRKSWSRVENDGGIFAFTVTGSGPKLTTSGALLPSPLRYELILDGLWDVTAHGNIKNRLVQRMTVAHKGQNTVVTFHLLSKPYRCSLHRPDARTASVRIR